MIAMTNSEPPRFPKSVSVQCTGIFSGESRQCSAAMVANYTDQPGLLCCDAARTMKLLVHRSALVTIIDTRPKRKMIAPIIRTRPGAFSYTRKLCWTRIRLYRRRREGGQRGRRT